MSDTENRFLLSGTILGGLAIIALIISLPVFFVTDNPWVLAPAALLFGCAGGAIAVAAIAGSISDFREEEQRDRAMAVVEAAREMVATPGSRYLKGLPDSDPYKGPGNRLADALAALASPPATQEETRHD